MLSIFLFYIIAAQTAVLDRTITKVMKNEKPDKKVSMDSKLDGKDSV